MAWQRDLPFAIGQRMRGMAREGTLDYVSRCIRMVAADELLSRHLQSTARCGRPSGRFETFVQESQSVARLRTRGTHNANANLDAELNAALE